MWVDEEFEDETASLILEDILAVIPSASVADGDICVEFCCLYEVELELAREV